MSDEEILKATPEPESEDEVEPQLVRHEADWMLEMLVDMANDGLETGITLQVSGFLVSGSLVSGKQYFEGIGTEYGNAVPGESGQTLKASFSSLGNIYADLDHAKKKGIKVPTPNYIHLKEARFFHTGAPIPGNRGVWWRGRLSEVAGFALGSLSPQGK